MTDKRATALEDQVDDELEDWEDDELEDEEDEEEEEAPPPPPKQRRAAPKPKPKPQPAPIERLPDEDRDDAAQDFGAAPPWGAGPAPIDLVSPDTDPYIRVERVESNGPSNGFEDGFDHQGYCGDVPHRRGFEAEIRRRWGGGRYRVTTVVNGKQVNKAVVFGGPSKDPDEEAVSEPAYGGAPFYGPTYPGASAGVAGAYGGAYAGSAYGAGGYDPYTSSPYQQSAYGDPYTPRPPSGGVAGAYQQARYWQDDSSQSETLRSELDELKNMIAEKDKALLEERLRREAEAKEAEAKRMFDSMKAEMSQLKEVLSKPGDNGDKFRELQLKMEQDRASREEMWRQKQWEEELAWRREQAKIEEQRRKDEQARLDRERRERLDREERERKDAQEQRKLELDRMRQESERSDKQFDRLVTMMFKGKTNPLDDLLKLKQIDGGGDLAKFRENIALMNEIKSTFAPPGEGEKSKLQQAQEFISGLSEAVTPIVGEVARAVSKPGGEQQPQYVAAQAADPRLLAYQDDDDGDEEGPTGMPTPSETLGGEAQLYDGATPEQWGRIMEIVVDSYKGGAGPNITASHLLTCLKFGGALGALPSLANSSVDQIRLKVAGIQLKKLVTHPHYAGKVNELADILVTDKGKAWVAAFLSELKKLYSYIVEQHKLQQAQQQQQGQPEQPEQPEQPQQPEPPQQGEPPQPGQ